MTGAGMTQVRKAAGLLAGELSRLDHRSGGALLSGVAPGEIYRGMLIVLMRLAFLMQAEEHGLLPAVAATGDHSGLFGPERYPWLEKAELSDQVVRDIRAELRRAGAVTEVRAAGPGL